MDLTALNLDPMPNDAYLLFAKYAMKHADGLLPLNMVSYYDLLDTFYDSRNGIESMLVGFFGNQHRTIYPRLTRLKRFLGLGAGADNLMESVYQQVRDETYAQAIVEMNQMRIAAWEYKRDMNTEMLGSLATAFTMPEPERLDAVSVNQFMSTNLAGWHKTKQAESLAPAIQLIRLIMPILRKACNERGAVMEFRNPIAYHGPKIDELYQHQRPIQSYAEYMGPGQAAVVNALLDLELGEWSMAEALFGDTGDPDSRRQSFQRWSNTTATAMIHFQHENQTMLLVPSGLPSALLTPTNRLLPVIITSGATPFINDSVVTMKRLEPDEVNGLQTDFGSNWMNRELEQARRHDRYLMSLGMSIVAACISVIAANVKVGSGNHKPTWIHTPLNAHTMAFMLETAPAMLSRLNQID